MKEKEKAKTKENQKKNRLPQKSTVTLQKGCLVCEKQKKQKKTRSEKEEKRSKRKEFSTERVLKQVLRGPVLVEKEKEREREFQNAKKHSKKSSQPVSTVSSNASTEAMTAPSRNTCRFSERQSMSWPAGCVPCVGEGWRHASHHTRAHIHTHTHA